MGQCTLTLAKPISGEQPALDQAVKAFSADLLCDWPINQEQ